MDSNELSIHSKKIHIAVLWPPKIISRTMGSGISSTARSRMFTEFSTKRKGKKIRCKCFISAMGHADQFRHRSWEASCRTEILSQSLAKAEPKLSQLQLEAGIVVEVELSHLLSQKTIYPEVWLSSWIDPSGRPATTHYLNETA